MRKTVCLAGIFVAGTGLMAGAAPAFADSADNDGINAGNDNNLSVLPIQLCGNNIGVLGLVMPILSPQANNCVNAPIVDHPSVPGKPGTTPPSWENPPGRETPGDPQAPSDPQAPGDPQTPGDPQAPGDPQQKVVSDAKPLPTAPTPVAVRGHHAVTG
ncbi:chaplin family protein [Saccharopolyspora shandongensis]|uniref:chaplin family protein n=1 Tax=Saccharopolyspora shandongensis TaxID=418495 RepID=UPI0033E8B0C8